MTAKPRIASGTRDERRRLLRGAFAAAAGGLLAGCDALSHDERAVSVLGSAEALTQGIHRLIASGAMAQEFTAADIAPVFRPNGTTMPEGQTYAAFLRDGFASWRLRVDGLVERPSSFSLGQLRAMPQQTQITRHDCVEGWSCIGQWTGVRLSHVLQLVGAQPKARFVVFHCMDVMAEGDYNIPYYESVGMDEATHPQTLLAWGLNGRPLPVENGAPVRARIERLLGYKQPKYLRRIELVDSYARLGRGRGGYWEDLGYNWYGGI